MSEAFKAAPGAAWETSPHQPVVEIVEDLGGEKGKGAASVFAPPLTRLRINGMDMGHFDGFRVHGAESNSDQLLRVTVTLIPSRLTLGIDDRAFGKGDAA